MSEYLKPQSPLYHKKEDAYFYPLTTADQVIMPDGSRLSAQTLPLGVEYGGTGATTIEDARENLGLGTVATENIVPISKGGTGATTIADAHKNLNIRASVYNILDNSNFIKPVNQRGSTEYPGNGYSIDRWTCSSSVSLVTLNNGYINFKTETSGSGAYMTQFIESGKIVNGRKYTVTCRLTNGATYLQTNTASTDMGYTAFSIVSNGTNLGTLRFSYDTSKKLYFVMFSTTSTTGMNICNVALYEGEYTKETLPVYQPKIFGAELAECQRYYQYYPEIEASGYVTGSGKNYYMNLYLPVSMRIKPTILGLSNTFSLVTWYARIASGGYSKLSSSTGVTFEEASVWGIVNPGGTGINMISIVDKRTTSAGDTNNSMLNYRINCLELSADL